MGSSGAVLPGAGVYRFCQRSCPHRPQMHSSAASAAAPHRTTEERSNTSVGKAHPASSSNGKRPSTARESNCARQRVWAVKAVRTSSARNQTPKTQLPSLERVPRLHSSESSVPTSADTRQSIRVQGRPSQNICRGEQDSAPSRFSAQAEAATPSIRVRGCRALCTVFMSPSSFRFARW